MPGTPRPRVFATIEALRKWFAKYHATTSELWIEYYKVSVDRDCVRYQEALDEALCWGWIDGTVRSIDDESYMQRWTPRRKGSYWSAVNIRKANALIEAGRMQPPGLAAFDARDPVRSGDRYTYETEAAKFPAAMSKAFRADKGAWAFWQKQPPGYKRNATAFILTAKKEDTRTRRFEQLLACSRRGERLPQFSPAKAPKPKRSRKGARAARR